MKDSRARYADAKKHAKNEGIKTGFFRSNKIHKNKSADGSTSYSIDNRKDGTSIENLGGDLGIMESEITARPNDIIEDNSSLFTIDRTTCSSRHVRTCRQQRYMCY